MTNTVLINGTDIKTTYNTILAKGSYGSLVEWPALKAVSGNDWQEYDGFEPDLSNPVLNTRTLSLRFILHGTVADIDAFYRFLGDSPKQVYNFPDMGKTLTLRLISMPSLHYAQVFHIMECQFAADTPLEGYTYVAPSSSLPENRSILVDDVPLSDYGVRVLKGTINAVAIRPDVKPLLIRNISTVPGATYDENPLINDPDDELGNDYETVTTTYKGINGKWKRQTEEGVVTYKSQEITLKCQMSAPVADFWKNYNALLYDLSKKDQTATATQEGARTVYISLFDSQFKGWYRSQKVTDFTFDGTTVWVKFDITLTVFEDAGDYY